MLSCLAGIPLSRVRERVPRSGRRGAFAGRNAAAPRPLPRAGEGTAMREVRA